MRLARALPRPLSEQPTGLQRTLADSVARLLDARLARSGRLERDAHRAGVTPGGLLPAELLATLAALLLLPGIPWGTN